VRCPECDHPDTQVLDTRASGAGIRRRRRCRACSKRFTTHERIERRVPLVVKRDGTREPYDREKVIGGLRLALRKRPVSARQIEEAAQRIEAGLGSRGGEVAADTIGRAVLTELERLDGVAYLRFASVYRDIDSAEEFYDLLRPWLPEEAR